MALAAWPAGAIRPVRASRRSARSARSRSPSATPTRSRASASTRICSRPRPAPTATATGRSASSPGTNRRCSSSSTTRAGRSRSRGPATRSRGAWRAGYDGAFGRKLNAPYVWLPLCAIFLIGLFDWRRPFRVAHLDLLVLVAGFGVSHFFFNRGEIGLSVPLAYPALLYLLARTLWLAFRGGPGLRPSLPDHLARDRDRGPDRLPRRAQRRRLERDRRRLLGRDRGRPDHRRRAALRQLPRRQPPRRHLRAGRLLRLHPVRAAAAVERRLGRPAGGPRGGDLLRPRHDRGPVPAGPAAAPRATATASPCCSRSPGRPVPTPPSRSSPTPTTRSSPCSSSAPSTSSTPHRSAGDSWPSPR